MNDYVDLLRGDATDQPANPYLDLAQEQRGEEQTRLRQSLLNATAMQPATAVDVLKLSKRTGLPPDMVDRNLPALKNGIETNDYVEMLANRPRTARFFLDPLNASLARDAAPSLGILEKGWDFVRSYTGGGVKTYGSTLAGVGTMIRTTNESLQQAIDLFAPLWGSTAEEQARMRQQADRDQPWFLQPSEIVRRPGQVIKDIGTAIEPPVERQDIGTDVASGLGQISAQIATWLATGGASGAVAPLTLFAQGADQMDERVRKAGKSGTPEGNTAIVLGGAVTALTEKMGLEALLERAAPPIRNAVMRRLVDVTAAGGIEATQEVLEGVLQNVLEQGLLDPTQPIFEGWERDAAGAGGAGAIARAIVMAVTPGRQHLARHAAAGNAEQQLEAFNALTADAANNELLKRSPEKFREWAAGVVGDAARVFLPAGKVREYLQSLPEEQAEQQARAWGVYNQIEEAFAIGGDVVMPVADYWANVVPTGAHEAFKDDLRLDQAGMSLRDAKALQEGGYERFIQEQGEALATTADDALRAAAPAQRVFDDAFQQYRLAGRTIDAARSYATVMAARYQTRGAQLGIDAWDAYQRSGIRIVQDLPESLRSVGVDQLDVLLEALRKGGKGLSDRQLFGPSLLEYIARRGGIVDTGGELAAMDADKWHRGKPGRRKLVRPEAMASGEALPGMRRDGGPNADYGADSVALAAWEEGFFPEFQERPSPDDLFEAIRQELDGTPRRIADNQRDPRADFRAALEDLEQTLSRLNIDPTTASNEEIKAALAEPAADEGRSFAQPFRSRTSLEFTRKLDALKAGTLDRREVLSLGPTPQALTLAGLPALPLLYKQGEARKTLLEKHAGTIDEETLRRLPDLIADPVMVMTQENGRYGVLIEDGRGQDVLVVIQPNASTTVQSKLVNLVVTVHPKTRADGTLASIEAGRVTYRHEGRSLAWLRRAQRQNAGGSSQGGFKGNIATEADIVKPPAPPPPAKPRGEYDQTQRGKVTFGDGESIITLFKDADLSTALHETGHVWLEELMEDARDPTVGQSVREDAAAVLKWFGLASDVDIKTEHHEQWARAVEAYFMEGKAPSPELRGVFERFKAWLVSIYRAVQTLNTPINDDIRGVLDRMIATDEAIAAARQRTQAQQLFTDPQQAGMTEAEFAAYQGSVNKARDTAQTDLLRKVMAAIRRKRTAEWKDQEGPVREEVTREIDARPDIRALEYLRTGKLADGPIDLPGLKFSHGALIDLYGDEAAIALLPKTVPPMVVKEGGVHPDVIAELLGYRTGEELVTALQGLEAQQRQLRAQDDKRSIRRYLIDEETRTRMLERHGDALADGSIEQEALDVIHSDERATVLAVELQALGRRAGREPTPMQVIREWARTTIAGKSVRDGASGRVVAGYLRAEGTAGRAVESALLAGDHETAFQEKQKQMISHALYAEARAAQEDVEKAQKRMDRYANARTIPSMDQEYLEQIHALLERFDFRRRTQKEVARRVSLRTWAEGMQAEGRDIAVPEKLLDEAFTRSYQEMTIEEFRGLRDSVDQIAHLGRLKKELLVNKERREFDAFRGDVVARLDKLQSLPQPDEIRPDLAATWTGAWARAKEKVAGGIEALTKPEYLIWWLDGRDANGPLTNAIIKPFSDAQTREQDLQAKVVKQMQALIDGLPKALKETLHDKLPPASGMLNQRTMSPAILRKEQLLAIMLNMGNDGNLQKLLKGEKWEEPALRRFVDQHATKEMWDFVQSTWNLLEELRPLVGEVERRVNGVEPEWVEAVEVITPFGAYRGGYYPLVYDPTRSRAGKDVAERYAGGLFERAYVPATTPKGHTKERIEHFAAPIFLSLDVLPRHLTEVVHDLTWREPVIQANKILNDAEIQAAIKDKIGRQAYEQFEPWLKNIANEWARDRVAAATWEQAIKAVRARVTMVAMGLRLGTMIAQFGGMFDSQFRLGGGWMIKGMAEWSSSLLPGNGSKKDFMFTKSGEMRNRANTLDRDIRLALRAQIDRGTAAGVVNWGLARAQQLAFEHIAWADRMVSGATWYGGYRKALAEGMTDEDAVFYADKMVRMSQGANAAKDLAAVQHSGEILKLATLFYSYHSTMFNNQRDIARLGRDAKSAKDWSNVLAGAFWIVVAAPLAGELLKGGGPGDDEPWELWVLKKIGGNVFGGIPLLRDFAGAVSSGYDYSFTPVGRMGEVLLRSVRDVGKVVSGDEPSERWVKNAIESVGYLAGLPLGQPAATIQFLIDVGRGEQQPDGVGQWLRGLMSGKAEEKKN